MRKGGSSGFVAVKIKTENISANHEDYEPVESKRILSLRKFIILSSIWNCYLLVEVQFQDGELEKFVPIKIFVDDKYECDEKFEVQIKSLYGNEKLKKF